MQNLIDRIGITLFIQVVIEVWNGVFLIVMTSLLVLGTQLRNNKGQNRIEIPFTTDILVFYNAIFLYNFFNILSIVGENSTTVFGYWLVRVSNFCYYLVGAFQTLFLLQLLKKGIADKNGFNRLNKMTLILQLMHIPLLSILIITPFTESLYYFDDMNRYQRGSLFWIWHVFNIITFIYMFAVTWLNRSKIDPFLKEILFTVVIVPMFGFILNTNYSGISFNNISVSMSALILFVLYEKHRADFTVRKAHELDLAKTKLAENQLALEHSRNEVLMAQVQPHFINNSLMALRAGCREYPEIYENITNLSRYLRSHFDALSDTKMISFEQEMENVEAYLELERINYGERLHIIYNIECDDFTVPALSVQPLVENAVRHGIGTYEQGGTVQINARKDNGKIIIEVVDDGTGKSSITQRQKKRKGIGIENVRSRLMSTGKGVLEISLGENGSLARIIINDNAGET